MRMREADVSPLLAQISDIEAEERQDFVDVAIIDKAEAVKLRQARFGLTVFEITDPIVRHVVGWVVFFVRNLLTNFGDPSDGQVQSLALRPEAYTSFETRGGGQHKKQG